MEAFGCQADACYGFIHPDHTLPAGSYHTFLACPVLGSGSHKQKVGHSQKGMWYEPSGTINLGLYVKAFEGVEDAEESAAA